MTTSTSTSFALVEIQELSNADAEKAVIGSVLINPAAFHECRLELPDGAQEFKIHRWMWVWQALESMIATKTPIDLLTVSEQLKRDGKLEDVGGFSELTGLINSTPTSTNAVAYARIIHDFYFRRQMVRSANTIASVAYDIKLPRDDVASKATSALNQAVRKTSNGRMITLAESVASVDKIIEANSKLEQLPGIPTPLIDLNKMMGGGAQESDLNLIVGRPGQGKTSLLLQIALHAAKHPANATMLEYKHVAVFSMEMPHQQLTMRLLAQLANIDYQMLRAGRLTDDQWAAYYLAVSDLSELDIYIDDTPKARPSYIMSRCEILKSQGLLDMLCVDSLNLMRSDEDFGRRTDQAIDSCAQGLKNIGLELTVPVWAAHQMNRGIEYRSDHSKPQLSDLREGGEQPADGVFFIHHELTDPDEKINSKTEIASSSIVCGKQRNGPTGEVPVFFQQNRFKFADATRIKFN